MGSAPAQQAAAAQHPAFQRAEDQQVDGDADEQDEQDRQEDAGHVGVVAAVVEQLAEAQSEVGEEAMISAAMRDRQEKAQPCFRPAR